VRTGKSKFVTVTNLPASSCTWIKRSAVATLHPNSRSSQGSQLPCPAIAFASISRRPISIMSATARLPSVRMTSACSASVISVGVTVSTAPTVTRQFHSSSSLSISCSPGGK
jgi:hypothetical protein